MSNLETAQFGNKHAPEQTLIDVLSNIDGAKVVVVVMLDKDDYVQTSWSDGSMLMRIGMMDVAKISVNSHHLSPACLVLVLRDRRPRRTQSC